MAILDTGVGEPKKFLAAKSEDRRLAAPRTAVHYQSSKIGYSTQACRTHMSITELPSYFQMPERPLFNAPQIKYAKDAYRHQGLRLRASWRGVLCDSYATPVLPGANNSTPRRVKCVRDSMNVLFLCVCGLFTILVSLRHRSTNSG